MKTLKELKQELKSLDLERCISEFSGILIPKLRLVDCLTCWATLQQSLVRVSHQFS
jgi:hypothetical protein